MKSKANLGSDDTRFIRWVLLFAFAVLGAAASILFAPSANAVSGPTPSPGFTIVEQKCEQVGTEYEQQLDGYDTITNTDEEGNKTSTQVPRYKTVLVTITQCDWIERKVLPGKGIWKERPELLKTVPCEQMDFFGIDPELVEEFCKTAPKIIDIPARNLPEFSDPEAEAAYQEFTVGNSGPSGGAGFAYKQIADPSTAGISVWPCWLTALDNSNPTIEIIDNLSIDEIDWAKFVNYKITRYNQASITFRSPNSQKPLLVSKSGPTHIGVDGETLSLIDSNLVSTAEWLSCKDAAGGSGGATPPTVRVLCPVYYTNMTVDGPYGRAVPALMDRKEYDPNSIRNMAFYSGPNRTEFGLIWKNYRDARRYQDDAMEGIGMVQKCGAMTKADMPHRLPYLGNYDIDARLHYTTCSYSLMPGFNNGAYFGGCTGALTWKPVNHTYHADCTGIVAPGADKTNIFDAARCFQVECEWGNDNSAFIFGKDASETPALAQHFDEEENVRLDSSPGPADARSDGTPVLWDGTLKKMTIRDTISDRRIGTPVEDEDFSVYEIDPESTPWNPIIAKNKPNDPAQFFSARVAETNDDKPFAVVPDDVLPKNVPQNLRFAGWNNLKVNAYQASVEDRPFNLKFHRVQPWIVPVRLGGFTTIAEYEMGGARPIAEDRQPTITCSTKWSTLNYLRNRLAPEPF